MERKFVQQHVAHNYNCVVTFYHSLLSISCNAETTVTEQCLCLFDRHVICGGLTAPLNVGTGRR